MWWSYSIFFFGRKWAGNVCTQFFLVFCHRSVVFTLRALLSPAREYMTAKIVRSIFRAHRENEKDRRMRHAAFHSVHLLWLYANFAARKNVCARCSRTGKLRTANGSIIHISTSCIVIFVELCAIVVRSRSTVGRICLFCCCCFFSSFVLILCSSVFFSLFSFKQDVRRSRVSRRSMRALSHRYILCPHSCKCVCVCYSFNIFDSKKCWTSEWKREKKAVCIRRIPTCNIMFNCFFHFISRWISL